MRIFRDAEVQPDDKSLAEVLADMSFDKDPELNWQVNIGFACPYEKITVGQKKEITDSIKQNQELRTVARDGNLVVPLEAVRKDWLTTSAPKDIRIIATHHGIYKDLFDNAYFYPWLPMDVLFDYNDEYVTPVYHGNHLKPSEANSAPHVHYNAKPGSLWTLVLVNLDCHFEDPDFQYLHWFVTNIPESEVNKGTVICDYLQPFPANGTGYHRYVFVLFKQNTKLDFSALQKKIPCTSLKERTFKMVEFCRANQDFMTPAGLSFFQSDWDESVTDVFHNIIDMEEPSFEYDLEKKPMAPQVWNPHKVPFDEYLDNHNDPKAVAAEVLQLRLRKLDPFEQEPPLPEHPLTKLPKMTDMPTWARKQMRRQLLRSGKYRDL